MEYIEILENILEKSSLGNYYAIYFPIKKEYVIVDDYMEANKYREGVYHLAKKFTSKEEAIKWAEVCKNEDIHFPQKKRFYAIYFNDTQEGVILTDPEEVNRILYKRSAFCRKFFLKEDGLEWIELVKHQGKDIVPEKKNSPKGKKKKYYGIYFIETGEGIILDSSIDVAKTVQNKASYCRKFDSEEKTLKWLEIVKKTGKNIEPETVKVYENIPGLQMLGEKYYGVYLIESQKTFITKSLEEANLALKDEKGLVKKFKKEKDAINWIVQCENNKRVYYAIFFIEELKSIIAFDLEMVELFIKDKANINRVFETVKEANEWLRNMEYYYTEEMGKLLKEDTIFFDVGTGRGIGEEVRVTDFLGNSIIEKLPEYKELVNEYGNYNLGKINNITYGELYGLYLALLIALENNIYKIAGDNTTVINIWSKGEGITSKILPYELELINKVSVLRKEFEEKEGEIFYINGGINPADLGFHQKKRKNIKTLFANYNENYEKENIDW